MPAATPRPLVDDLALNEALGELLSQRARINKKILALRQRIARPRRIPCHCLRCGHDWMALKRDRPPLVCARCGSRYWNRERQAPRYGPPPTAPTRDPMPPVVPPPPTSDWRPVTDIIADDIARQTVAMGLPPPPPLTPLASPTVAAPEPEAAPTAPAAEGETD